MMWRLIKQRDNLILVFTEQIPETHHTRGELLEINGEYKNVCMKYITKLLMNRFYLLASRMKPYSHICADN